MAASDGRGRSPPEVSDEAIALWDDIYANISDDYADMTSHADDDAYVEVVADDGYPESDENIYEDIEAKYSVREAKWSEERSHYDKPHPGDSSQPETLNVAASRDVPNNAVDPTPCTECRLIYTYEGNANHGVKDYDIDDPSTTTTLVRTLSEIGRGDHVTWKRSAGVWHHAVVVDVDGVLGRLDVVHYNGDAVRREGSRDFASVRHERVAVTLRRKDLFRVEYNRKLANCFEPDEVVQRAFSRIGEAEYHPITNNCEHFARWCKTGEKRSVQLENLPRRVYRSTGYIVRRIRNDGPKMILQEATAKLPDRASSVAKTAGHIASRRAKGFVGRLIGPPATQLADTARRAHDSLVDGLQGIGLGGSSKRQAPSSEWH